MKSRTKGVREDHHTVTPYIIIKDAVKAITFYKKKAFGAAELMRITNDRGKVQHAEIIVGDSSIMIVDEFPEFPIMQSPQSLGELGCIFPYMSRTLMHHLHKLLMQVQRNWRL